MFHMKEKLAQNEKIGKKRRNVKDSIKMCKIHLWLILVLVTRSLHLILHVYSCSCKIHMFSCKFMHVHAKFIRVHAKFMHEYLKYQYQSTSRSVVAIDNFG